MSGPGGTGIPATHGFTSFHSKFIILSMVHRALKKGTDRIEGGIILFEGTRVSVISGEPGTIDMWASAITLNEWLQETEEVPRQLPNAVWLTTALIL
jgi:hypothetical protein